MRARGRDRDGELIASKRSGSVEYLGENGGDLDESGQVPIDHLQHPCDLCAALIEAMVHFGIHFISLLPKLHLYLSSLLRCPVLASVLPLTQALLMESDTSFRAWLISWVAKLHLQAALAPRSH